MTWPTHLRGAWAKSTIRAMLENPTYLGYIVWDKLDYSASNGSGRRRARPEKRVDPQRGRARAAGV
jgi:hypothetical protein